MKFLLLLYDDAAAIEALPADQRRAIVDQHIAYSRMLRERGAFVYGDPLDSPETARTLRIDPDGHGAVVTDGPFLEAKEALGGLYILDADSIDTATELARGVPRSAGVFAELLPIVDM
jgi:hypothetical protein